MCSLDQLSSQLCYTGMCCWLLSVLCHGSSHRMSSFQKRRCLREGSGNSSLGCQHPKFSLARSVTYGNPMSAMREGRVQKSMDLSPPVKMSGGAKGCTASVPVWISYRFPSSACVYNRTLQRLGQVKSQGCTKGQKRCRE